MELGLGIDIGSACTDAVMVDLEERRMLAWNKGPTTPNDLVEGVADSVSALLLRHRFDPRQVKLVGLSTTLATDSILESRGGRVGLIGIGWEHDDAPSLGAERWAFVKGGHDSKGQVLDSLDETALREAVSIMAGEVEAFVVSSKFSVCQPDHEDRAREVVREMTKKPVVAAHELSGELSVMKRSAAAVLNARLLPVIANLLDRIEAVLKGLHIQAKVIVLKGDGSAMPIKEARVGPVQAVLSGPAASLMGGTRLTGLDNCLVVDIGGTSTDIAYFDGGFPRISCEGADVARWHTKVKSIDSTTVALGGDSEILSDVHGNLRIGPGRVLPLALAGERSTKLIRMIMERRRVDFLVTARSPEGLTGRPLQVYRKVEELGLCDEDRVRDALPDLYLVKEKVGKLVLSGHLLRTGLTPTDIFNLEGSYHIGNLEASRAGVEHYLEGTRTTPEAYCARIMHRLAGRLAEEVVRKVVAEEVGDLPADQVVDGLIRLMAGERSSSSFHVMLRLDRPIVGVGGPARLLIPSLRDFLGADVVIPDGGQAASAVGAVCGRVYDTVTTRIQPLNDGQFQLLTPFGDAQDFCRLEDAIATAKEFARLHVWGKVNRTGAKKIALREDVREVHFRDQTGMEHLNWIEVTARASGEEHY